MIYVCVYGIDITFDADNTHSGIESNTCLRHRTLTIDRLNV
jgi:hypothetical protein